MGAIIINATKQFAKMFIRFLKNKTMKKVRQYVSNYKVDIDVSLFYDYILYTLFDFNLTYFSTDILWRP